MADKLVKAVSVKLSTEGYEDAKLKIDKLDVAAKKLGDERPEIKPQIDSAAVLLKARLLRDGIKKELSGSVMSGGGGGLLRRSLFSFLGGGGSKGLFSGLDNLNIPFVPGSGLPAILAGGAGVAALLPELGGLVAGLSAATAGVGAFGLLAIPTFDKIKNAYTTIDAAQQKYNAAVALNKENPTKTNANAAAAALVKLRVAQESIGPSTRKALDGIHDLIGTFDKMAKAFQPTVMKVFNDGLRIANQLLPTLKAPAQAAGTAIDGLLQRFSKFTQSKGFQDWLGKFDKLIGPSITAIGIGIGKVINQVGKLITSFSSRDVVHAINIFFDVVSGAIFAVSATIRQLMRDWDRYSADVAQAWRNVKHWTSDAVNWFKGLPGMITHAIGDLGSLLLGQGKAIITGLIAGVKSALPGLSGVLGGITSLIPKLKGPMTVDRMLLYPNGQAIMGGLMAGIGSRVPDLHGQLAGVTAAVPGMAYGGGYRAGGNSYHITVNVPPGSQREAGRQIVNAIRAFEQGSGHGWRK